MEKIRLTTLTLYANSYAYFKNRKPLGVILLILISVALFGPLLTHFFAIDDFFWIWNAKYNSQDLSSWVQAFTHINGSGQYRPLSQQVFFWFCYQLFGMNPLGYHIVNLMVYLVACFFLYKLLHTISSSRIVATCSAALFCFSSVHFEHLGWTAAFTETLATLFVCMSLYAITTKKKGAAIFWYILGLCANETTIIVPLLAFFYYLLFRRHTIKTSIGSTLGLWIVLFVYMGLRLTVFGGLGAKGPFAIIWSPVVWLKETFHSLSAALNFNVDLKYIFLGHAHWKLLIIAIVIVGVGSIIYGLIDGIKRKNMQWRLILLGFIWFVIGLLPVLPFANNFADYTIAIPLIGLSIASIGVFGNMRHILVFPIFATTVLALALISMYGPNGLYQNHGYITLSNSDYHAYSTMLATEKKVKGALVVNVIGSQDAWPVIGGPWMAKIISNDSRTTLGHTNDANLILIYQPETKSFIAEPDTP